MFSYYCNFLLVLLPFSIWYGFRLYNTIIITIVFSCTLLYIVSFQWFILPFLRWEILKRDRSFGDLEMISCSFHNITRRYVWFIRPIKNSRLVQTSFSHSILKEIGFSRTASSSSSCSFSASIYNNNPIFDTCLIEKRSG